VLQDVVALVLEREVLDILPPDLAVVQGDVVQSASP